MLLSRSTQWRIFPAKQSRETPLLSWGGAAYAEVELGRVQESLVGQPNC